ncbi:MAG: hypothetical protein GXP63_03900 [DPANN group archaeon]|nr:hypothetical protein [DPANN group archaeon]
MSLIAWLASFGIIIVILIILGYIFWLVMFIDALKRRDTLWILLFVLSFFTGFLNGILATIYYFVVYKPQKACKDHQEEVQI